MCAGYYKLMVAAKQEEKILIPNPQFDNEVVRYEHRFGAFANLLTPPLMPYTQFKVGTLYLNSWFIHSKTFYPIIFVSFLYVINSIKCFQKYVQEVLEHTEKASIQTLYTAASRDFGQARQILETVQVRGKTDVANLWAYSELCFRRQFRMMKL